MSQKIIIVGDVFFSKKNKLSFFNSINKNLKEYIVIANLEGSVNFKNEKSTNKAIYLSLQHFKKSEIPKNLIFSLVNNHVTDFGINNFYKNIEYYRGKVVISSQKKISNIIGGKKFIFLADKKEQCITKGTDFLSFSNEQVSKISNEIKSSTVIVHGGLEFRHYPTLYQRALSRKIIEYGAERVIFHHSHIIGHYEYWNGKLIHYGLGNAFFSNTLNVHALDKSISHGVVCNDNTKIVKLNKLKIENKIKNNHKLNIKKLNHKEYVKFYKKLYPLDSSFRPRQLCIQDIQINIQFYLWSLAANFCVRKNISKKIKNILNIFLK